MFERKPLRTDVGAEILGRIIDGRIASGSRINESHLAEELGISRTPLREAMLCLTTEGVLDSDMGRGFRVPHLAGQEITDLLGALAVVLPATVRQAADADIKTRVEVGNILGRARMQSENPGQLCEQIYLLLRSFCRDCPNKVLRDQCRLLVRRSLRFLFEAQARGWQADELLGGIETALSRQQRGDRVGAADILGKTLRDLGTDLASRFPAEVGGQA
jgi:DNA-binding GntR family transcriptional regulator